MAAVMSEYLAMRDAATSLQATIRAAKRALRRRAMRMPNGLFISIKNRGELDAVMHLLRRRPDWIHFHRRLVISPTPVDGSTATQLRNLLLQIGRDGWIHPMGRRCRSKRKVRDYVARFSHLRQIERDRDNQLRRMDSFVEQVQRGRAVFVETLTEVKVLGTLKKKQKITTSVLNVVIPLSAATGVWVALKALAQSHDFTRINTEFWSADPAQDPQA